MKAFSLISIVLFSSTSAMAGTTPEACVAKARENVEAVSQIMYAPAKLDPKKTIVGEVLAKSDGRYAIEITTYDATREPLTCTYLAEMESNTLGDCWLVGLTQTECSQ